MRRFPASLSRGQKVSTTFAVALMLLVPAGIVVCAGVLDGLGAWLLLAVGIPVGAAALVWALAPRAFLVGDGVVAVERRAWKRFEVPISRVRRVALLPPGRVRGAIRVAGSGGVFGNYGRFWTSDLGTFRMYATRTDRLVLVDTDRERLVVSPDDAEGFADAIRARVASPPSSELPSPSDKRPMGRRRVALMLALSVGLPVAIVGCVVLYAWARAPQAVHVSGDAIRVERRLGATEIPLSEVRAVEPLEPARLRGLVRVAGTAFGDVRFGRFRTPSLGSFQLEQHRGRGPWVLVDTADARWVLTPDDPQAFLEAARSR